MHNVSYKVTEARSSPITMGAYVKFLNAFIRDDNFLAPVA